MNSIRVFFELKCIAHTCGEGCSLPDTTHYSLDEPAKTMSIHQLLYEHMAPSENSPSSFPRTLPFLMCRPFSRRLQVRGCAHNHELQAGCTLFIDVCSNSRLFHCFQAVACALPDPDPSGFFLACRETQLSALPKFYSLVMSFRSKMGVGCLQQH